MDLEWSRACDWHDFLHRKQIPSTQVVQSHEWSLTAPQNTLLISACQRSRRWMLAEQEFRTGRSSNWISWKFDIQIFQAFGINFCSPWHWTLRNCLRLWQQALDLFHTMPQRNVTPNTINFNATISSCSSASQWPWALHLFHAMPTVKASRDVISYNATITSFLDISTHLDTLLVTHFVISQS